MTSRPHVKICGIKTPQALEACAQEGARFVGFVFYPPSPRHVAIDTARELALIVPTGMRAVGLFVDPSDAELEAVLGKVQLDMIQLHGAETPQRVAQIKEKYAMPIVKAFPVREAVDIDAAQNYPAADWFLFDAKSSDASVYGGTGQCFDWSLLAGRRFDKPWMLSGGLTTENIGDALSVLAPAAVDVSSGVEISRGEKDIGKIHAFIRAAKGL